jgi:hypothetical protein
MDKIIQEKVFDGKKEQKELLHVRWRDSLNDYLYTYLQNCLICSKEKVPCIRWSVYVCKECIVYMLDHTELTAEEKEENLLKEKELLEKERMEMKEKKKIQKVKRKENKRQLKALEEKKKANVTEATDGSN